MNTFTMGVWTTKAPANFPNDEHEENVGLNNIEKNLVSKDILAADPPLNQEKMLNINIKKEPIDVFERLCEILEAVPKKDHQHEKYWHDNQLERIYPIILQVLRNGKLVRCLWYLQKMWNIVVKIWTTGAFNLCSNLQVQSLVRSINSL